MWQRCKQNLSDFWWGHIEASSWGKIRFLFYGLALIFGRKGLSPEWAQLDPNLYRPIGIFSWFHPSFPTTEFLAFVHVAWFISVLCAALGLLTRFSVLMAFLTGFYFISFTNSFGHQYHSELPLLFGLFLMNFVSVGQAFSLDSVIKKKLGAEFKVSFLPVWPLRLLQTLWVLTFFFSGLTKLRRSGLGWIFDDTLQYFLVENAVTRLVELKGQAWETAGLWLAQFPTLCTVAALFVILFELSTPLAFLGKRWALFFVVTSLVFLFSVFVFMGVGFGPLVPMVAFWMVRGSVWTPTKRN